MERHLCGQQYDRFLTHFGDRFWPKNTDRALARTVGCKFAGIAPRYPQQANWQSIPATGEYWKALGLFLIYGAAFALSTVGTRVTDGIDPPTWITVILAVVSIGVPFVVLIWGAILTSRQICQKTGYPSSPEGLILMLFATCIAAALISLPFAITAWAFLVISLPLVVWIYLAILQRRLAPPSEATEQDRHVQSV